jgi:MFS family permease
MIGLFGTIFFIGNVAGSFFLSKYGDTVGRIKLIRIGQSITIICYTTIIFFTTNLFVIYALIFVIGALSCWRLSLGFIYG